MCLVHTHSWMELSMPVIGFGVLVASGCGVVAAALPRPIDAKVNVAVLADGTGVELYALDQAHANNPGACWTPAGVPITSGETISEPLPSAAQKRAKRSRRLFFH